MSNLMVVAVDTGNKISRLLIRSLSTPVLSAMEHSLRQSRLTPSIMQGVTTH